MIYPGRFFFCCNFTVRCSINYKMAGICSKYYIRKMYCLLKMRTFRGIIQTEKRKTTKQRSANKEGYRMLTAIIGIAAAVAAGIIAIIISYKLLCKSG